MVTDTGETLRAGTYHPVNIPKAIQVEEDAKGLPPGESIMKSLWNEQEAARSGDSPLAQRVYTSRLIGKKRDLVLHGGGNTSVKTEIQNIYGETEKVL